MRGSQAGGSAPRAATTRRTGPAADHAQAARTRSNSAGHKDSDSETLPASKAAAVSDSEAASARAQRASAREGRQRTAGSPLRTSVTANRGSIGTSAAAAAATEGGEGDELHLRNSQSAPSSPAGSTRSWAEVMKGRTHENVQVLQQSERGGLREAEGERTCYTDTSCIGGRA